MRNSIDIYTVLYTVYHFAIGIAVSLYPRSLVPSTIEVQHVIIRSNDHSCTVINQLRFIFETEWDKSNIFAFGARSAQHLDDLKKKMSAYNCRNVICMKEDFLNSDPDDPKFKNVKVCMYVTGAS